MSYSRPARRGRAYRPRFEVLEARHLLSTYVVDRLTDTGAGSGLAGDLRYCINQAADGDAITFGVTGTINLASALPGLAHNISIEGPGADLLTVSGPGPNSYPNNFRVFTVLQGGTVSVSGLTITHGYAPLGGGVPLVANVGGGIANFGTLTLSNSTVTGNIVDPCPPNSCFDQRPPSAGGGIFNGNKHGTAVLTIINSTVSGNEAPYGEGGGIANGSLNENGGVEMPAGTVILSNSNVSRNVSTVAGGIFNGFGGWLMVTNSTLSGNSAGAAGGIYNPGTLTVSNSTLSGNSAGAGGGGIYNGYHGTLTVSNSTLSGNAGGSEGGGIYNYNELGGLAMGNTILAGNYAQFGTDLYGQFTDDGYNLIGVDPQLGPLQDNGGPTPTMALLAGSPALNAGDPSQLGVADQRGVLRTGAVNIGAYQASASAFVLSAPDTVDPGAPFDLTVAAVDPFGQPAYGYTGTVTFATTDPDPGVVLPADYAFTPADQGTHTFSGGVTLVTPGDQVVSATDTTDNTIAGSATVTVTSGGDAPGRQRGADGLAAAATPPGDRRAADAGQALPQLRRAQAAGYFKDRALTAHMKQNADLDALRSREDFRKLAAELDAVAQP
jgi:hypothetical protein